MRNAEGNATTCHRPCLYAKLWTQVGCTINRSLEHTAGPEATTPRPLRSQLYAQVKLLRSSYNACQEFAVYVADIYGVCYPLNPLERKEWCLYVLGQHSAHLCHHALLIKWTTFDTMWSIHHAKPIAMWPTCSRTANIYIYIYIYIYFFFIYIERERERDSE